MKRILILFIFISVLFTSVAMASTWCTGTPDQNLDIAKQNFEDKCDEPYDDQKGHSCEYKSDGFHCNGNTSAATTNSSSTPDSPTSSNSGGTVGTGGTDGVCRPPRHQTGEAAVELQHDGSWYNRRAGRTHNNTDERFGDSHWNSHGYYMDITSWTGEISVDYPVPDYNEGPEKWGIPFTVSWVNNRPTNAELAHEEFNIRRRRSWHYGGEFGYGTTPISDIPTSDANMTFAGRWDECPEGSVFINMTMWVQSKPGDMGLDDGRERIDIIVHEYDTGEFDLVKQAPEITLTKWTVLPDLHMAGSIYKVIKRKPGDKGEKCSYNLVRASGDNRLSGTLNAHDILDHLIKDDEFNNSWNIADAEWTVTAQGPVYRNYLEGGGLPMNEILTTPSKGKWTFTDATFPDIPK